MAMGYQVYWSILNACHYGLPQARKRCIIVAAAPGFNLPQIPVPKYYNSFSKLTVKINGRRYTNDFSQVTYRLITVGEAIEDLPKPYKKDSDAGQRYKQPTEKIPVKHFQRMMRGNLEDITDHISKPLNDKEKLIAKNMPRAAKSAIFRSFAYHNN